MITLPSVHLPFINVALPSRMRNEHGPSECATLLSIFDLLGCLKTPLQDTPAFLRIRMQ